MMDGHPAKGRGIMRYATCCGVGLMLWVLVSAGCSAEAEEDAAGRRTATNESAATMTETQKIEHLIGTVAKLRDAVFVRNGKEYDCKEAAEHMRRKWKWKEDEIETARDFIRIAASASSMSGKPYLIRFKDGREVKSADFLNAELDKLGAAEKGE